MTLFDPIRHSFVPDLPEERVRQKLIDQMLLKGGFPKSFLCVEKELNSLPHLQGRKMKPPKRRLDLLCFAKGLHPFFPLYPLLLVECKKERLTQKAIDQVIGYNYWVGAFFVAIASLKEVRTFWYEPKEEKYRSLSFLPSYLDLYASAKNSSLFL